MGTILHADKTEEQKTAEVSTNIAGRSLSSRPIRTGVDAFSAGTDTFFGRDAFGSAPAVTASAPMGAEQGGLLSWFKGMFGKSGDAEDSAPEQEASETDAQPELTQNNDPREELDDAAEALRSSKKWGLLGNSDKFENVSAAIHTSVGKLNTTLSGDLAQDQDILGEITASFRELINACDDYITSHDPSTDRGKHRQDIVRQVRELAAKDLAGFSLYMSSPDKGEHVTNAIDILKKSRQRTLQLVDKNEEELEHVGGAASYIAKIEPGMLTDENASGFFKEDEVYTYRPNIASKVQQLERLEIVRRKLSLSDAQYEEIKTAIESGSFFKIPKLSKDRTFYNAIQMIAHMDSANDAVGANISHHMEEGESLNLSKRNVATSRLAELLGLGDLIAKSETATLVDKDGTQRTGNLMQAAEGQEVEGYVMDQLIHQNKAELKQGLSSPYSTPLKGNMDDKVTPEFLKSLMSLQVLDNLAAQVDRHAGNYFAQIKDGKLGKVQGIDNDFSFSDNTLEYTTSSSNRIGTHGKNILDEKGELMVPYMDKTLADRITALDESVLRDVMADILEPWAIDALCIRFDKIKKAIQKDQEKKPDSGRYLERDEDWGKKEVFDTLRNATTQKKNGVKVASNYVANFLKSADMSDTDESTLPFKNKINGKFRQQLVREILQEAQDLGDEKQAKEFLAAHGVPTSVLSYLETTGQLLDGPALLKRMGYSDLEAPISAFITESWKKQKK